MRSIRKAQLVLLAGLGSLLLAGGGCGGELPDENVEDVDHALWLPEPQLIKSTALCGSVEIRNGKLYYGDNVEATFDRSYNVTSSVELTRLTLDFTGTSITVGQASFGTCYSWDGLDQCSPSISADKKQGTLVVDGFYAGDTLYNSFFELGCPTTAAYKGARAILEFSNGQTYTATFDGVTQVETAPSPQYSAKASFGLCRYLTLMPYKKPLVWPY